MNTQQMDLGKPYPLTAVMDNNSTLEQIAVNSIFLFAKKGYDGVTMRDIADSVGIKPASLYNYFTSKEALWNYALARVVHLYKIYFERLDATAPRMHTFEEVHDSLFVELKEVANIFIYYGIGLVQVHQFYSEKAADIFLNDFLRESIDYIERRYDDCIERGLVGSFDTKTAATILMHSVMVATMVRTHEDMGREVPYDVAQMYTSIQEYILANARAGKK